MPTLAGTHCAQVPRISFNFQLRKQPRVLRQLHQTAMRRVQPLTMQRVMGTALILKMFPRLLIKLISFQQQV